MQHDVLVVGAGPTGLALALWLTRQSVRVRIVAKASGPGTTSRAMAVQARTLELYRQLDLADACVADGKPNPAVNIWVKGKKRAHVPLNDAGKDMTPYPYLLVYPQDRHERLLVSTLAAMGVSVEWSTELVSFEESGGGIVARLKQADGAEERCEAAWLAGCDGAHSVVRGQIGSGFPGGTYPQTFYVADVEIAGPAADGETHIALDTEDFVAVMAYDDHGGVRLIGTVTQADEGRDLSFADVGHRAIEGLGLTVETVNWFSTYRVHHRVTDHYRSGRAFLLGDAAHIHSPAGGQGMNTGIGDAINLAWKLAAVIHGKAPDTLLDSYEAERRAFAEKLVATTDRLFTFATAPGSFADFVRTRIVPLFVPIVYRAEAVREYMFRVVSQVMIEYRASPVSFGAAGGVHGGDRLPWVAGNDASLCAIVWQMHVYGQASGALAAWCESKGIALSVFDWTDAHEAAGLLQDACYLIRPDTYVACALPAQDVAGLEAYCRARGLALS